MRAVHDLDLCDDVVVLNTSKPQFFRGAEVDRIDDVAPQRRLAKQRWRGLVLDQAEHKGGYVMGASIEVDTVCSFRGAAIIHRKWILEIHWGNGECTIECTQAPPQRLPFYFDDS